MDNQYKMPLMGEVGKIETLPDYVIDKLKTRLDAVRTMINWSGLSNEYICEQIGIDKGHFSRILKGKASVPDDHRYTKLVDICRNNAPLQWEARFYGYKLKADRDDRIEQLESELEELKKQAWWRRKHDHQRTT